MSDHPLASRLGWLRPADVDERDALMAAALAKTRAPDDALADKTIRQAYDEGYFTSWKAILAFWRWIKSFFSRPKPPPPPDPAPTRAKRWFDPDQLDQGNTAHCVGFSATQFLNADPVEDHLTDDYGHALYYACVTVDGVPGSENGSYVHTAAKVLRTRGRIVTYVWARSLQDIKEWVLTQGPVVVGTDWLEGMFDPDSRGFVSISGAFAGGHAYLLVGYDEATDIFTFQNSWGAEWGDNGFFYCKAADWARLFDSTAEAMSTTELPLATIQESVPSWTA